MSNREGKTRYRKNYNWRAGSLCRSCGKGKYEVCDCKGCKKRNKNNVICKTCGSCNF